MPEISSASPQRGFINVGQENSTSIELYYEDHGSGPPVVLIHGWPLNGDAWEKQTAALLAAGHRVITYDRRGDLVIQANWTVAIGASPVGTLACVDAWLEDFRKDISRNDLPTMIIHGDDDHILPADVTSRRQAKMIKGVTFMEIKGGSHGLLWTHAEEINAALVEFLA
jgi:pimeloyl-ACP methyl ester carboxylesterase